MQKGVYGEQSRREKPTGRHHGLTQQKRQKIKEAFELFNTDGSGVECCYQALQASHLTMTLLVGYIVGSHNISSTFSLVRRAALEKSYRFSNMSMSLQQKGLVIQEERPVSY
ncbi:calcium-binding protein CML19-like isoform X2 [Helianthus annuus]|uniref:calcium-binding protein CML19-like isoform X2 n=1 Tax=Helianthus annuus TaxID=4232 RepID=UPI001652D421|nr:calcium-binding protein CML19-like isoform X2 [Helianthus annuus]